MPTNFVKWPLQEEGSPPEPQVSFGGFLRAHTQEAFRFSPMGSPFGGQAGAIPRMVQLGTAKRSGNQLSPEEATETYGIEGHLEFSNPITDVAAHIMQQRKLSELKSHTRIAAGGRAFGKFGTLSGFVTEMATSMLDPINAASLFIPVVGEGRFAAVSSRTLSRVVGGGRTSTRLATGAIEGVVGQAVVEPFVLAASIQEQADYTISDSVVAVLAGAVLGAGAHAGLGKVVDIITGYTPETRISARQAAIGQIADGRPVDVSDIVVLDRNDVRRQLRREFRKQFALSTHALSPEANVFPAFRGARPTDTVWRVVGLETAAMTKAQAIRRAAIEIKSRGGKSPLNDPDFEEIPVTTKIAQERSAERLRERKGGTRAELLRPRESITSVKKNDVIVRLDKKRVRSRLNRNTVRGEDEFIVTPSFDKARPSDRVWQVKRSSRGTVVEQGLTKPEAIGRARDILRDEGIALTPEETVLLDRAVEREIHRRFKDIHQRRRMEASRPGASESPAPPLEPGPEGSPIPRQIETTPTTKEIESDAATAAGEGREIEANLTRDEPISEAETEFIAQNTIEGEPKLKDAITRIEACIKKNIGR